VVDVVVTGYTVPMRIASTASAVVITFAVGLSGGCAPEALPVTFDDLRINEVAASGTPLDWVELVTIGDVDVSLDGLFLTDDATDPGKGAIPGGLVVAPGEFVVIEIDEFGVGFRIGSDEQLVLIDTDGLPIDTADWAEGGSPDGGSFGRSVDGAGVFVTFAVHTRGASNVAP